MSAVHDFQKVFNDGVKFRCPFLFQVIRSGLVEIVEHARVLKEIQVRHLQRVGNLKKLLETRFPLVLFVAHDGYSGHADFRAEFLLRHFRGFAGFLNPFSIAFHGLCLR